MSHAIDQDTRLTLSITADSSTIAAVCDFLANRRVVPTVPVVSDPAALYATLYTATPPVPPAVEPTRDERVNKVREAVKQKGGKFFGDYCRASKNDKPLSEWTDDELAAIYVEAAASC